MISFKIKKVLIEVSFATNILLLGVELPNGWHTAMLLLYVGPVRVCFDWRGKV